MPTTATTIYPHVCSLPHGTMLPSVGLRLGGRKTAVKQSKAEQSRAASGLPATLLPY